MKRDKSFKLMTTALMMMMIIVMEKAA